MRSVPSAYRNHLASWQSCGETRIPGLGSFRRHELEALLSTAEMRELHQLVASGNVTAAATRIRELAAAYRVANPAPRR